MILDEPKRCLKCNKESQEFYSKTTCINCRKLYLKEYQQKNKNRIQKYKKAYRKKNADKIKKKKKDYASKNKQRIAEYKKNYYQNNKKKILQKHKKYYISNKKTIKNRSSKYYKNNKSQIKEYQSSYYRKNKSTILKKRNRYAKLRRKRDVSFRLRLNVSLMIRLAIKKESKCKNGSIIKYLPYTINDLKMHLESQFEPWMNWNNWGKYIKETWNDNDKSTWMWQIDHIIPQSHLIYNSMEHPNFKKCWALSNIRPLSAKENLIKSNKRN